MVEGITVCSEFRGHDRFLPIIQGVSMNDSQMKVHCTFLKELAFALHIQSAFLSLLSY